MAGAPYAPLPQRAPDSDQSESDAESESEAADQDEAEARKMYLTLDRKYLAWMLSGLILGPFVLPFCRRRHGPLSRYVSPLPLPHPVTAAEVAAWLGVLLGLTVHGLVLLVLWFLNVGGITELQYLGLAIGAYALTVPAAAVPAYFFVRKQHADLLEPVEPAEVFALRCSVRDCLACGNGELLDLTQLPQPPRGTVPIEHVRVIADRVNLIHGALRDVGCWVRWLIGAIGVAAAVTLLLSSYAVAHYDRLMWALPCACVEAAAVATFYASFYFEHWMFCRRVDVLLRVANSHRRLVHSNLAWVLRRTHLTRVVRLKLIVRNTAVRALHKRRCERWWEAYAYLDSPFRDAARVLLLANARWRRGRTPSPRWLPAEVLLHALGYAAPLGSAAVMRPRRQLRFIAIV